MLTGSSPLSNHGVLVNESPCLSIEVVQPIAERVHHLPQKSGD
jgi:hypothetical protein